MSRFKNFIMSNFIYVTLSLFSFLLIDTNAFAIPTSKECHFGDCQNGFGKEISQNENYVGHFEKGVRNGFGICIYKDGTQYIGNWKQGVRHSTCRTLRTLGNKSCHSVVP